MRSQWFYDPFGGFAFQTDDSLDGKTVRASRLTLIRFEAHPNGQVNANAFRAPAYHFGLADPVMCRISAAVPCPERLAELCDRHWSAVAVAGPHALDRLGANGGRAG